MSQAQVCKSCTTVRGSQITGNQMETPSSELWCLHDHPEAHRNEYPNCRTWDGLLQSSWEAFKTVMTFWLPYVVLKDSSKWCFTYRSYSYFDDQLPMIWLLNGHLVELPATVPGQVSRVVRGRFRPVSWQVQTSLSFSKSMIFPIEWQAKQIFKTRSISL